MIPVNVLSEPTLAVREGHRPAHSRPADPTREYEPGSGTANCPPHRPGAPNQTGRSVLRGAGPARQIANRHAQPETGLRKLQRLDRPFHMNIHVPFWLAGMRSVLSWLWRDTPGWARYVHGDH